MIIENSNLAIIGGGKICKSIIKILSGRNFAQQQLKIKAVADINSQAVGITFAKKKQIHTTKNFNNLFKIEDLDYIIELTGNDKVLEEIKKSIPQGIELIDHYKAMSLLDYLQIKEKTYKIKEQLTKHKNNPNLMEKYFDVFSQDLLNIVEERTNYLQNHEKKIEALYKVLFNTDPNPIFIIDNKTFKILKVNQRAQDYYQYSEKELLKMSFLELNSKPDLDQESHLKSLTKDRCIFLPKKSHIRKDGHQFYTNINVCYSKFGDKDALIVTTTDISKSMEKELQLIQTSKMTTLGVMAAGIAHELNQPLNVIQVGSDFILKKINRAEPIDDKEFHTIVKEMNASVQRAAEIINQLRTFSRQSDMTKTEININAPLEDVYKILNKQLKVHQIKFDLDKGKKLPKIKADHNRLIQVFINLVINAMDALDEHANKIKKKSYQKHLRIKSFYEKNYIVVTISDNGTGMTDEIKEKIFEPFFTTKEAGKGTGLGISISYSIIRDFDGIIEVNSELNKGTTFIIKFPIAAKK